VLRVGSFAYQVQAVTRVVANDFSRRGGLAGFYIEVNNFEGMCKMAKDAKMVVAKLYNLKSYIEGKIMEVNEGICEPDQAFDNLSVVVMKTMENLDKQSSGT